MCVWCLYGGEGLSINQFPHDPETTFVFPQGLMAALHQHIDWESSEYLPTVVRTHFPKSLVPLRTTGDGNCLLNAVSRAIFGVESYWEKLREAISKELEEHLEWYKTSTEFEQQEWDEGLKIAKRFGTDLNFCHILALSNVLKRPIIMYASDADIIRFGTGESGVAATFVPSRHPPSECTTTPIYLSWGSNRKNHYVPLLGIEGQNFPTLPVFPVGFPSLVNDDQTLLYINQHEPLKFPPILTEMNKQAKDPASFGEHYTSAETLLLNRIATRARARNSSSFFQDEESDDWGDVRMRSSASPPSSRRIQIVETADGKRFLIAAPSGQKPQLADGRVSYVKKTLLESDENVEEVSSTWSREEMLKYFDHVFTVKLGEELYLNIGHRKGDSLDDTVNRFLKENKLSEDKREAIFRFLTTNIPFDDRKPLDTRCLPRYDPLLYQRLNNKPDPSNDYDRLFKKLLEFNATMISELSIFALTPEEEVELHSIISILKAPRSTKDSEVDLTSQQCTVLTKLLRWKSECLFPTLDMLRLLITYPKIAALIATKKEVLALVVRLSVEDNKMLSMLSLKFIANMFSSGPLKEVAMRYATKIIQGLVNVALVSTTEKLVRSCIASIVLNYSIAFLDHYETQRKTFLGGLIHQLILKGNSLDKDNLQTLLLALGNILWKDKASRDNLGWVVFSLIARLVKERDSLSDEVRVVFPDLRVILGASRD